MKKAACLAKGMGTFVFGVVWKQNEIEFLVYRQPSRSPPAFLHWGALVKRNQPKELLDLQEIRSQRQKFRLTCQSAWMLGVESDLLDHRALCLISPLTKHIRLGVRTAFFEHFLAIDT
jgi:hypothetical protein